jgi:hypothetical protein
MFAPYWTFTVHEVMSYEKGKDILRGVMTGAIECAEAAKENQLQETQTSRSDPQISNVKKGSLGLTVLVCVLFPFFEAWYPIKLCLSSFSLAVILLFQPVFGKYRT